MTGAGWTKGSDGIWAKGGQKASFTINSTTGNKRRELTETVMQQQLKDGRLRHEDREPEGRATSSARPCRTATTSWRCSPTS